MAESRRLRWSFPNENMDPWYDAFAAFVDAVDASVYATREDRSVVLMSTATVSFNIAGVGGVLTWNAPIELLSPIAGFVESVSAGSVTLNDGDVLYMQVVRSPTSNQTLSFSVARSVPNTDDTLLVAIRRGSTVYWRDGKVINDGDSLQLFSATGGGGGGGGSLPPGVDGGVLAYSGGAYASTAAGTSGQFLRSNGTAAPSFATITAASIGAAANTLTLTAGTGLSGGGNLTANRSFAVVFGDTAGTVCEGNDTRLSNARTPSTAGSIGQVMGYGGGGWQSTSGGTVGQVLRFTGGLPAWGSLTATDVNAIPVPINITNRGVLYYNNADGEFELCATPPADRYVLIASETNNDIIEWSNDVAPLTLRAFDLVTNAVSLCATFTHDLSTGNGAANIGARCLFRNRNGAGVIADTAAIDAVATTVTNGAEVGALDIRLRSSGSLVRVVRFTNSAIQLDWISRAITLRDPSLVFETDVWRVDGGNRWVFGNTDTTNCGGVWLQGPSNGEIDVRRGTTSHFSVNSGTGATTMGATTTASTIRGSSVTFQAAPVAIIDDATSSAPTTLLTLRHTTTGTAAAGIGTRISLQTEDAAGGTEDAVYLDGVLTNAGNGSEASAFEVQTRTGGAALRRVARVTAAGGLMLGSAVTQDPGVGGISMPTTTGIYIESGGTLYNAVGVFGGSAMSFGSGAFNVTLAAFALTISSAGGTVMSGGYLDLAAGFRRRVTDVTNANHVVTAGQSVINLKGLTAARVVTSPAAGNGIIVTITNSDGSATGANTVTFTPATGTVNGAASHVAVNAAHGSCTYLCDGTNWTVIAKV